MINLVLILLLFLGCASGKIAVKGDIKAADDISVMKNEFKAEQLKIQNEVSLLKNANIKLAESMNAKIVAYDTSENTNMSAARDMIIENDSKMIEKLWKENTKVQTRLLYTFYSIIIIFIIQMCGLVLAMIKARSKAFELSEKSEAKLDKMQMDLIEKLASKNGGDK